MPFQNAHYSRMRAFRQGNLPLYFVANYVLLCAVQDAQCNTEESPLKKNKNKKQKQKNRDYSYAVNAQIPNKNYFNLNSRNLKESCGIASKAMNS